MITFTNVSSESTKQTHISETKMIQKYQTKKYTDKSYEAKIQQNGETCFIGEGKTLTQLKIS